MSSIFIKADEEIVIKFFIANHNDGIIFATTKEELLKKHKKDIKEEDIKEETILFRRPNYKDNVEVFRKSIKIESENLKIDPVTLRYTRFCSLIKSWSFKDIEGNIIPADSTTIDKLNPDLAGFISEQLESKIG